MCRCTHTLKERILLTVLRPWCVSVALQLLNHLTQCLRCPLASSCRPASSCSVSVEWVSQRENASVFISQFLYCQTLIFLVFSNAEVGRLYILFYPQGSIFQVHSLVKWCVSGALLCAFCQRAARLPPVTADPRSLARAGACSPMCKTALCVANLSNTPSVEDDEVTRVASSSCFPSCFPPRGWSFSSSSHLPQRKEVLHTYLM